MSNVEFSYSADGKTVYGTIPDGTRFCIDADMVEIIKDKSFYRCRQGYASEYLTDCHGIKLHEYLYPHKEGYEIDHINLNTFDNRRCNIRYCTHQQNQMNQPIQKNNTSGVSGVSWYAPRGKFRARIKISQHEIHLGYYGTFEEAVQARNVGMECMFGEYGRYNDVPPVPKWIKESVIKKCKRFANLSVCKAFFVTEVADGK